MFLGKFIWCGDGFFITGKAPIPQWMDDAQTTFNIPVKFISKHLRVIRQEEDVPMQRSQEGQRQFYVKMLYDLDGVAEGVVTESEYSWTILRSLRGHLSKTTTEAMNMPDVKNKSRLWLPSWWGNGPVMSTRVYLKQTIG